MVVDSYGEGFDEGSKPPELPVFGTRRMFERHKEIVVGHIKPALDFAREIGLQAIYVENVAWPPLGEEFNEYGLYTERFWCIQPKELFTPTVVSYSKVIEPRPGEFRITKRLPSAFENTELNYLLNNLGIKNIFFVGFTADVCLFRTILGAWDRNYRCLLLRDCTLGWETFETGDDNYATQYSISYVEKYIGFTVTSQEFLSATIVER
jgi:nicotinamidase-related amidase